MTQKKNLEDMIDKQANKENQIQILKIKMQNTELQMENKGLQERIFS